MLCENLNTELSNIVSPRHFDLYTVNMWFKCKQVKQMCGEKHCFSPEFFKNIREDFSYSWSLFWIDVGISNSFITSIGENSRIKSLGSCIIIGLTSDWMSFGVKTVATCLADYRFQIFLPGIGYCCMYSITSIVERSFMCIMPKSRQRRHLFLISSLISKRLTDYLVRHFL